MIDPSISEKTDNSTGIVLMIDVRDDAWEKVKNVSHMDGQIILVYEIMQILATIKVFWFIHPD